MGSIDWGLDRLVDYQPPLTMADDFHQFWQMTVAGKSQ